MSCDCDGSEPDKPYICMPCRTENALEKDNCVVREDAVKCCPLCGSDAVVWEKFKDRKSDSFGIVCVDIEGCGLVLKDYFEKDALLRQWNKEASR